jgi:hypothetical protein
VKEVILVPPMIERDVRNRGRWSRSAYENLFGDTSFERKSLFLDHFISSSASPFSLIAHLSPPDDERLAVKATIRPDGGQVQCRYFPFSDQHPGNYICFSANLNPSRKASAVSIQASAFDPSTGLGGFANAPLDKRVTGAKATAGIRYTSSVLTCGAIATMRDATVREGWLIARYKALLLGVRVKEPLSLTPELRERSSLAVSYSPSTLTEGPSDKSFVAELEVVDGSRLTFAISQRLALVRRVLNPFEDKAVIGITSYLTYGLKMTVPIDQQPPSEMQVVEAAASYQVNKNWLVKAKCGTKGLDAIVGFRMWSFPSLLVLLGGSYSPQSASPLRWGLSIQLENHGDLLYERGGTGGIAKWERGRAVLEKHEASQRDLRNSEGVNSKGIMRDENYNKRLSVRGSDRFL